MPLKSGIVKLLRTSKELWKKYILSSWWFWNQSEMCHRSPGTQLIYDCSSIWSSQIKLLIFHGKNPEHFLLLNLSSEMSPAHFYPLESTYLSFKTIQALMFQKCSKCHFPYIKQLGNVLPQPHTRKLWLLSVLLEAKEGRRFDLISFISRTFIGPYGIIIS